MKVEDLHDSSFLVHVARMMKARRQLKRNQRDRTAINTEEHFGFLVESWLNTNKVFIQRLCEGSRGDESSHAWARPEGHTTLPQQPASQSPEIHSGNVEPGFGDGSAETGGGVLSGYEDGSSSPERPEPTRPEIPASTIGNTGEPRSKSKRGVSDDGSATR